MQTNPRTIDSGRTGPQRERPAAILSGYGTLLHEERQLQGVVSEGIAQAEVFGGKRVAGLLRHQRDEVKAIIAMLSERAQQLPTPARFTGTHADQTARPRSLRTVVGSGTGHQAEELHTDLEDRFVQLTFCAVASNDDGFFARLSRRHHEMAGTLHVLLKQPLWARQIPDSDAESEGEQTDAIGPQAVWENEGGSPIRDSSSIVPTTAASELSSLPE